jgi:peptidoglycan/LPS O-acetylase OafA/YrhL
VNRAASIKQIPISSVVHGTYYPHIDGIRALAIIPVLVYHLCAWLCPGGYAGVDVFFVISGYLITGGILKGVESGNFTISEFYKKRVIRIFPAYFAMILGVLTAGAILYYSGPLRWLGNASLASGLFISNLFYAKSGSGYFHGINDDSPLLNLWSLSVEEQFYLFVPLLILLLARHRVNLSYFFSAVFIGSLTLAEFKIHDGDANGAFFYLQYRSWELLAGSLLGIHMRKSRSKFDPGKSPRGALNLTGLALVIAPYFLYTKSTPFPGIHAIPSVLGTVLLIRFADEGPGSTILKCQSMTFIGKISYSLYLWHWPVFCFWSYYKHAEYFGNDVLNGNDYIGMLLVAVLLGYASWRFVEMPFRLANLTKYRSVQFASIGISLIVIISVFTIFTDGWRHQLHPDANRHASSSPRYHSFYEPRIRKVFDILGVEKWGSPKTPIRVGASDKEPEFIVVGDSFAGNLEQGANAIGKTLGISGVIFNESACLVYEKESESASRIRRTVDEYVENTKTIRTIIIRQAWPEKINIQDLAEFCSAFRQKGLNVIILSASPNWSSLESNMFYGPSDLLAKTYLVPGEAIRKYCRMNPDRVASRNDPIDKDLAFAASRAGCDFLNVRDVLKDDGVFFSNDPSTGSAYYSDQDHLDTAASVKMARFVLHHHLSMIYDRASIIRHKRVTH